MSIINSGDIHGCDSISTTGIKCHIRPACNDFGSAIFDSTRLLDDVRTRLGKSGSSSNLCVVQLPCSESKFKETNK